MPIFEKKISSDTSCGRKLAKREVHIFLKKVLKFEIFWPTPATPRALTVKGVYGHGMGKLLGTCVVNQILEKIRHNF